MKKQQNKSFFSLTQKNRTTESYEGGPKIKPKKKSVGIGKGVWLKPKREKGPLQFVLSGILTCKYLIHNTLNARAGQSVSEAR